MVDIGRDYLDSAFKGIPCLRLLENKGKVQGTIPREAQTSQVSEMLPIA